MSVEETVINANVRLAMVLDWVYTTTTEDAAMHIEIGIWDWNEPYTYYAVVKHNSDGSTAFGESSYDSKTVGEAVQCLLDELYQ